MSWIDYIGCFAVLSVLSLGFLDICRAVTLFIHSKTLGNTARLRQDVPTPHPIPPAAPPPQPTPANPLKLWETVHVIAPKLTDAEAHETVECRVVGITRRKDGVLTLKLWDAEKAEASIKAAREETRRVDQPTRN